MRALEGALEGARIRALLKPFSALVESFGVPSLLFDFGLESKIRVVSDASAALGIVKRLGLGKVRHLDTADLWVQQRVNSGDIKVDKVDGKLNPADAMTKGLAGDLLVKHSRAMGWIHPDQPPTTSSTC